jgi:hypothetical protein
MTLMTLTALTNLTTLTSLVVSNTSRITYLVMSSAFTILALDI